MQVKQFVDKYDKEFVGLMLEIDKRVEDYPKSKKLKINSWVRTLCFPTNNISFKKNRNLYTILLLDNIINDKLESPFDKFCDESAELPILNPTIVKSKISNKFLKEINLDLSDGQIQNYINLNFNTDLNYDEEEKNYNYFDNYIFFPPYPIYNNKNKKNLNKSFEYKINRPKTPQQNRITSPKINYKSKPKKHFNNNYTNNLMCNYNKQNKNNNYFNNQYQQLYMNAKTNYIYPRIDNNSIENKSDILLKKNYFNFNEKLSNERGFYTKSKPRFNNIENYKLMSMIGYLSQESQNKQKLIDLQQKEINLLKKRVVALEKKWNYLFK